MALVLFLALALAVTLLAVIVVKQQGHHDRLAERVQEVFESSQNNATGLHALTQDVRVIDGVVAAATRWPSTPAIQPWSTPPNRVVLLLPGAAYHLPEVTHLAEVLRGRGVPSRIASGRPHWLRVEAGARWITEDIFDVPSPDELGEDVSAVVALKDWGGYGDLVAAARARGIPTFAKVEGAQDFGDIDTGQDRKPYTHADHILCQGQNDFDALAGSRFIVGSTRLERLWSAPPAPRPPARAIINVNFTYGVLDAARELYVRSAIEGCEAAGIPYTLAIHPEEYAIKANHTSTIPISRLLDVGTVLISRFSTVPFEAMARDIPFIYHNPHGEEVPLFQDAQGAFDTSTSADELAKAIANNGPGKDVRQRSSAFFNSQVDIDPANTAAHRAATVIARVISPVQW
ncbi:MAG TPA: hypothetical protein ENG98_00200 [Actinobacteria bacterium]|nr:hypothetical protein [Actinomycetota bacterium]